jgi:tRNA threonylcarbamoyladenosine biosynthesis protein TsaB
MRVLGIDTSSRINTIGLIDGDRILADFAWEARDNSLQRIILNIDLVLKGEGFALADVEGLAVGIGPGSWTGVRVGVTVGKILAYAANKPICGISSLDALAYQAKDIPSLLCPLVDAGRENVYAAFHRARGGTTVQEGGYYVGHIMGLLEMVEEPALFLGSAAHLYHQIIAEKLGSLADFGGEPEDVQRGSVVALLAWLRLGRGESDDALSLSPLYLRESAAQALLARRIKNS